MASQRLSNQRGVTEARAGHDAPLRLAASRFPGEPCDPIRGRWVLALALMAAAAVAFMSEALYAAMDRHVRFALAPAPFQWDSVAKAEIGGLRGDRLDPAPLNNNYAARNQVHVEQLTSTGLSVRPFTHVVAVLAHIPEANLAAQGAAPDRALAGKIEREAESRAAVEPDDEASAQPASPPPIGEPINVTQISEESPSRASVRRVVVARAGDRLAAILRAVGMAEEPAQSVEALYDAKSGLVSFAGGEKVTVVELPGPISRPPPPSLVRVERSGQPAWVVARADDGAYAPIAAGAPAGGANASASAFSASQNLQESPDQSIRDSLNGLVAARGVDRTLVDQIERLCAHDFDLDAPVAGADKVEFLYTPGENGQPQLRYLSLTTRSKARTYYRFTAPDDGSVDYYDRDGRSVTKFLIRKPVPGGRLGDGFGWRIHPILKSRKFHEGVDYDAPLGSPIEAAGAGVVEKIGQETGYGKYIRIRHDLGYETTYAHVAGFAHGVRVGTRVRQGEVIAYVGSTGLSTGPHLYYEVRINGHNVDPLRIRLADGRVLAGPVLADFESRRERTDELVKASVADAGEPIASASN